MCANGCVLLVEDNRDEEELMLRAMGRARTGHETVVVRDGGEAIDYLQSLGDGVRACPRCIILDLELPKVTGLEVLRRIRRHELTRHIPVIVLTSSDEPSDIARSYASGANSYVLKPLDFDEFVEVVRQLLNYWLNVNTPRTP